MSGVQFSHLLQFVTLCRTGNVRNETNPHAGAEFAHTVPNSIHSLTVKMGTQTGYYGFAPVSAPTPEDRNWVVSSFFSLPNHLGNTCRFSLRLGRAADYPRPFVRMLPQGCRRQNQLRRKVQYLSTLTAVQRGLADGGSDHQTEEIQRLDSQCKH